MENNLFRLWKHSDYWGKKKVKCGKVIATCKKKGVSEACPTKEYNNIRAVSWLNGDSFVVSRPHHKFLFHQEEEGVWAAGGRTAKWDFGKH